jgi:type IV secretory pathway ATPase VirB11/archaellum biosynthesis ATPase
VEITIAELVRNGTLDSEMAAVLWEAVDRSASFLTVAIPRFAGKSTLSNAVLALRPPGVELRVVAGEPEVMERLKRERLGGYLIVGELSKAPVPGYIWGAPVRRVFEAVQAGYSFHTALHAPGVVEALREITEGNGVPDDQASIFDLVLYIERMGTEEAGFTRRLAEIYELDRIEDGRPQGRTLFRWDAGRDEFRRESESTRLGRDRRDLERRAGIIDGLAGSGRTSESDVAAAVTAYRGPAR